jgi:hypothetical protein
VGWQAIFDLVKNTSEVMLSTLPNFWKIAKNFMDGKYKKVPRCCPFHYLFYTNYRTVWCSDWVAPQPFTMSDYGTGYRETIHLLDLRILQVVGYDSHGIAG